MTSMLESILPASPEEPALDTRRFYVHCLALLDEARVPCLVGGGYAMAYYSGIIRHTKDLDVFIRPEDRDWALEVLKQGGYRTEITWPHFLAKALHGDAFVDLIYRSGNGLCEVDDKWFAHAVPADVLGYPVMLCPAEETLWSKSFVQERDRFDGADVSHLILRRGARLDWNRLLHRFGDHYRVLLAHLVMFGFIYPSHLDIVPQWVMQKLIERMNSEASSLEPVCNGTLLSKRMYHTATDCWGYRDVRLAPWGTMSRKDADHFDQT